MLRTTVHKYGRCREVDKEDVIAQSLRNIELPNTIADILSAPFFGQKNVLIPLLDEMTPRKDYFKGTKFRG